MLRVTEGNRAGALGLATTGAVFAALQRDKLADLISQRAPA